MDTFSFHPIKTQWERMSECWFVFQSNGSDFFTVRRYLLYLLAISFFHGFIRSWFEWDFIPLPPICPWKLITLPTVVIIIEVPFVPLWFTIVPGCLGTKEPWLLATLKTNIQPNHPFFTLYCKGGPVGQCWLTGSPRTRYLFNWHLKLGSKINLDSSRLDEQDTAASITKVRHTLWKVLFLYSYIWLRIERFFPLVLLIPFILVLSVSFDWIVLCNEEILFSRREIT